MGRALLRRAEEEWKDRKACVDKYARDLWGSKDGKPDESTGRHNDFEAAKERNAMEVNIYRKLDAKIIYSKFTPSSESL